MTVNKDFIWVFKTLTLYYLSTIWVFFGGFCLFVCFLHLNRREIKEKMEKKKIREYSRYFTLILVLSRLVFAVFWTSSSLLIVPTYLLVAIAKHTHSWPRVRKEPLPLTCTVFRYFCAVKQAAFKSLENAAVRPKTKSLVLQNRPQASSAFSLSSREGHVCGLLCSRAN